MNKKYNIDTDIMRIICSYFVVLLHTVTCNKMITTLPQYISETINILCRFSIPIFIMISGRYMLEQNTRITSVLKRSLKMFGIMVCVSLFYMINDYIRYDYVIFDITDIVVYLLTSPIHLWYMYTTIVLYIFTPVLSVFAKNATKQELLYAIFLCLFFGSALYIPLHTSGFGILKEIIEKCQFDCTLSFVGCYLLGYYFYKFDVSAIAKIIIYLLGICGFIISLFGNKLLIINEQIKDLMLSFFAPNVISQSVMFFYFCKSIFHKNSISKSNIIIHNMAKCTFGIYLWHVLILQKIIEHIYYEINIFSVLIISVFVYIINLIIVLLYMRLKKVFLFISKRNGKGVEI